eukprot:scaffold49167_cov71-Phaeocystis_antarctica.AAC.3
MGVAKCPPFCFLHTFPQRPLVPITIARRGLPTGSAADAAALAGCQSRTAQCMALVDSEAVDRTNRRICHGTTRERARVVVLTHGDAARCKWFTQQQRVNAVWRHKRHGGRHGSSCCAVRSRAEVLALHLWHG